MENKSLAYPFLLDEDKKYLFGLVNLKFSLEDREALDAESKYKVLISLNILGKNIFTYVGRTRYTYFWRVDNKTLKLPEKYSHTTDEDGFIYTNIVDKDLDKQIDDSLNLTEIHLRLDKESYNILNEKAKKEGMIVQAYLRKVLEDDINK
jgi:predicted DNA binding CopG/RHH family protein